MTVRVYERVSSTRQKLDSQRADLDKYAERGGADGHAVKRYADKFTGKTTDRPGLKKLLAEVQPGDEVVVWRLDRLGRTAIGLHQMFELFQVRKINFVSVRDALDLKTPAGRLVAGVLASVAAWETEVRAERVAAGLDAKRARVAAGKEEWNVGRPKGTAHKLTAEKRAEVYRMKDAGTPVAKVARLLGLSRQTVYTALSEREPRPASSAGRGRATRSSRRQPPPG
jgi:DNA invertase Pin-like site-specific DNA recombinase